MPTIKFRDNKGRFVSKEQASLIELYNSEKGGKRIQTIEEFSKLDLEQTKSGIKRPEKTRDLINYFKDLERESRKLATAIIPQKRESEQIILSPEQYANYKSYEPLPFQYQNYSYMIMPDGKYKEIDEKSAKDYYDIISAANKEIHLMNEVLGYELTADLSYSLLDRNKNIYRRLQKAEKILNGTYRNEIATNYKESFIENFTNHSEKINLQLSALKPELKKMFVSEYGDAPDVMSILIDLVNRMDDLDFLKFIKDASHTSLSYKLESIITNEQYDLLVSEMSAFVVDLYSTGKE